MDTKLAHKAKLFLIKGKTWRYLRYLHLREYISKISDEIETICVCGAGHGIAELLIANEFPNLKITLTDIIERKHGYPNYHRAMELSWQRNINNIRFSVWNVLKPAKRKFDLICSTEMLEHIEDDKTAAENMRNSAKKYIYCLVPFADKETNANAEARRRALESHEHFVCGYDYEDLTALFPDPVVAAGTYWPDRGGEWRRKMEPMAVEEVEAQFSSLIDEAEGDLISKIPVRSSDCQGIKILSKV